MTKLKRKRMMSLILAMSLMLTMLNGLSFQVTAVETEYSAYSILDTGTCGDKLTWTLYDNGTLIISGTGTMFDYNSGSAPWYLYREAIQRIVIEDEVCNIGSCAFDSCFAVTEVAIGDAVESIGSWAFASCSNLRQIDIGKNVNFIAAWAFAYCSRLGMVRLSDSLTKMEGATFAYCDNLTTVIFGQEIVEIGDNTFIDCPQLNHIFYMGTEDQWNAVEIKDGNGSLLNSTKHYDCLGDELQEINGCTIKSMKCVICNKILFAINVVNGTHSFSDGNCTSCGVQEDCTYYITDDEGNWGCDTGKSLMITGFYGDAVIIEVPETIEGVSVTRIYSGTFWNTWNVEHIFFWGDAPIIEDGTFEGKTLTCYYPKDNITWTEEVFCDYGGDITWVEHSGEIPTVITRQPWSESRLYGSTIELSTATNKDNVSYQWQYRTSTADWNNATDSGNATETVSILFSEGMDGYQYRCAITDESGKTIFSNVAALQLLDAIELQLGATVSRPDDHAYGAPRYFYFTPNETDVYALIGSGTDYFYSLYDIDMQYIEQSEDGTYVLETGHTYIFETDSAVQGSGVMTLVAVHNYVCADEQQSSCTEDNKATYMCTYCNDSYMQIPHTYDEGVCTICGDPFSVSGTCGENLNWELTDDGTLTIFGTGNMPDYATTVAPWYRYAQDITGVIIKDGVTHIGDYAFCYCNNLTDIVISTSVSSIGCGVFEYCNSLKGIYADEGSVYYSSDSNGFLFNADKSVLVQAPATYNGNYKQEKNVFIPPAFEETIATGVPNAPTELNWSEIYQDGMGYKVGVCGTLISDNNQVDVFFYNSATNNVWLKLRVLDENDTILTETGLIKPNEYIKTITFDDALNNNQKVKLKIMAYQPETYYSEGSIILNANIQNGG